MDTLKNVRFEHLSQEQQELSNLLGFEVFLTLVERCGGTQLYVPKAETVGRAARNAMIRAEYNGGNIKALAAKYHLSDIQIRNIISGKC